MAANIASLGRSSARSYFPTWESQLRIILRYANMQEEEYTVTIIPDNPDAHMMKENNTDFEAHNKVQP